MSNYNDINGSSAPIGWTCSGCGGFILFGQSHACQGSYPQYHTQTPVWTNPYEYTLQRIASAFERIAIVLELIAGQEQSKLAEAEAEVEE